MLREEMFQEENEGEVIRPLPRYISAPERSLLAER